jgi:hypothetical protein
MSRITKEIASAVAKELCSSKQSEISDLRKELQITMRKYYLSILPDNIVVQFGENSEYFKQVSSVKITGENISNMYKYYSIGDALPQSNSFERLNLTPKQSLNIVRIFDLIDDKEKAISDLKISIEVALYNLRTYGNVEKQFPEAFEKLPPITTTAVMINIKDIRCKLDKANC